MNDPTPVRTQGIADILAIGFATAATMWFVGFVCRMPVNPTDPNDPRVLASGPVLLVLILLCLVAGGFVAGRHTRRGWKGGLFACAATSLINLLVLGSLLNDPKFLFSVASADFQDDLEKNVLSEELKREFQKNKIELPESVEIKSEEKGKKWRLTAGTESYVVKKKGETLNIYDPSVALWTAAVWVPGSILVGAVLGALGAWLGSRCCGGADAKPRDWAAIFGCIGALVMPPLLIAGGLVTSLKLGTVVPDWPRSFNFNMFLFPFSRMTGGVYFEHAHRLLGSLIGLTTVVLSLHLFLTDRRSGVKFFSAVCVTAVVLQGVMGGLRVTHKSLDLAIVHGVFAQVIFGLLVALGVVTSATWLRSGTPAPTKGASFDRKLTAALLVLLMVQLVVGAILRHKDPKGMLILHLMLAFFVAGTALLAGIRAWAKYADHSALRRSGIAAVVVVLLQVVLGFAAFIVRAGADSTRLPTLGRALVNTAHQTTGAVLLGMTVLLLIWTRRLLTERGTGESAEC